MNEITLSDQKRLIAANVEAAITGGDPVSVESIVDITASELRAAGLTALDSVIGYAKENPIKSFALVVAAGVGVYFLFKLFAGNARKH